MNHISAIILAAGQGKRMRSPLPKVLHTLRGRPMIEYCVEHVRQAGIEDVIVVVGRGRELVEERLGASARYAVQEPLLGTGHAVMQAVPFLDGAAGSVLVCYGDMPLLSPSTIRRLIEAQSTQGAAASVLTVAVPGESDFGRVLRGPNGQVIEIVEVRDASPVVLAIRETNAGVYCFDLASLRQALPRLDNHNAQGEYYLTDVIAILAGMGERVVALQTEDPAETLGINDLEQLKRAEQLL